MGGYEGVDEGRLHHPGILTEHHLLTAEQDIPGREHSLRGARLVGSTRGLWSHTGSGLTQRVGGLWPTSEPHRLVKKQVASWEQQEAMEGSEESRDGSDVSLGKMCLAPKKRLGDRADLGRCERAIVIVGKRDGSGSDGMQWRETLKKLPSV